MYFNYSEIYKELTDNWQQIQEAAYPEDLITEFSDSATPIYYSDILKDWQEMPAEFNDAWQDQLGGQVGELSIMQLMQIDLFEYYRSEYFRIYEIIKSENDQE